MNVEVFAKMMGAGQYAGPLAVACARWGIANGPDVARFIAQLYVESAGFKYVSELTGYRAEQLLRVFKGRNGLDTLAEATALVNQGPRYVFNFIYGGAWGKEHLGNTEPDDGWNYRGRGLIQITGRTNYRLASIGQHGDTSLLDDPDKLTLPYEAADSAAWYWRDRRLNGINDVREVTRRINAGLHQLSLRQAMTTKALKLVDLM